MAAAQEEMIINRSNHEQSNGKRSTVDIGDRARGPEMVKQVTTAVVIVSATSAAESC